MVTPRRTELPDLVDRRLDEGRLDLGHRRHLLLGAEALGAMRAGLLDTLGREIAAGLLFRFGHALGEGDAEGPESLAPDAAAWRTAGGRLAVAEGLGLVEVLAPDAGDVPRGRWLGSFEVEQHLARYGRSEVPVCWMLAGYVSALATATEGGSRVCVETTCVARGDAECTFRIEPTDGEDEAVRQAAAWLEPATPSRALEARIDGAREELEAENASLSQANDDLRELYRSRTELLADVSHELRTPLGLIAGLVEELVDMPAGTISEPARERLRVVQKNTSRLARMVGSVLDLTRLGAGRMQLELRPVQLAPFLGGLAESFRSGLETREVELDVVLPEGLPPVPADPEALEKIVGNLLANAMKFTPAGGRVTLRLRRYGGAQVIEVRDTGPGIAPDELPHVFERYHQGHKGAARSHEGLGLGLALVHELVHLLGGEVQVHSQPGDGTTFRVFLAERRPAPGDEPEAPVGEARGEESSLILDAESASLPESASPPESRLGEGMPAPEPGTSPMRARILVVEDNADLCRYLVRLLSRDWDVAVAGDGADALEMAESDPPDLVLSDVMMPRMDGLTLTARLRSMPSTREVPVLLLTARGELEHRLRGFNAGADDYVVKPFAAPELVARIRVQIALRQAQRDLRSYAAGLERLVDDQVGHILRQNKELARTNRELEDFLTIASHDLKSPLVSIGGFTDLLEESLAGVDEPGAHAALDRIRYNIGWMHRLIDRLLSLAAVRAPGARPVPVDLDLLFPQIAGRVTPAIEAAGGRLVVAPGLGRCRADPTRIEEALANLLENAVKYRHPDRPPHIEVRTHRDGEMIDIEVEDNGLGIADDHLENVFQPLYRLGGGVGQGSGLGLYIVRRVAEEAGGRVWATSRLGQGTTMHVRLPAAAAVAEGGGHVA